MSFAHRQTESKAVANPAIAFFYVLSNIHPMKPGWML